MPALLPLSSHALPRLLGGGGVSPPPFSAFRCPIVIPSGRLAIPCFPTAYRSPYSAPHQHHHLLVCRVPVCAAFTAIPTRWTLRLRLKLPLVRCTQHLTCAPPTCRWPRTRRAQHLHLPPTLRRQRLLPHCACPPPCASRSVEVWRQDDRTPWHYASATHKPYGAVGVGDTFTPQFARFSQASQRAVHLPQLYWTCLRLFLCYILLYSPCLILHSIRCPCLCRVLIILILSRGKDNSEGLPCMFYNTFLIYPLFCTSFSLCTIQQSRCHCLSAICLSSNDSTMTFARPTHWACHATLTLPLVPMTCAPADASYATDAAVPARPPMRLPTPPGTYHDAPLPRPPCHPSPRPLKFLHAVLFILLVKGPCHGTARHSVCHSTSVFNI